MPFRKSIRRLAPLLGALAFCAVSSASADTTTLTIADATKATSNAPVTMLFPVSRTGDLGYEAILNYHTADGTALAGTDYTAANGSIAIPAGVANATIPVTLSTNTGNSANLQFQLMLDSAVGIGPAPAFAAQQTFATGTSPYSVTVADVNGDGKPDLIVANYSENTVSVLLNTTSPGASTPSFAAKQSFPTGSRPISVIAADVNGDGKPDLIIANNNDKTISVLFNTTIPGASTPSFAAQQTFGVGTTPSSVSVADVNHDGKLDLIVANSGDNTVSVLFNTTVSGASTPAFAAQQTFTTGGYPTSVIAADVNGDGKPDLIVANEGSSTVSVLFNTTAPGAATASFAAQQTFAAGSDPFTVIAADVNGDGKPDLIVANANSNSTNISVLLNITASGASTPNFAALQTFATGVAPNSVIAADVNGDGKPDLIVANYIDDTVSVLRNTTAPGAIMASFSAQQTFATGFGPSSVIAADVNGDGKPDLIVANNNSSNTVSVLLNTTAPTASSPNFSSQQTFGAGTYPYSVAAADLNGDGRPDLVVANRDDNTVSVLLNTSVPGAVTPSFAAQQTFATGASPYSVTVADVNGDGKPDLIVANNGDNTVSVLLNTTPPGASTPSFATQQTLATGIGPGSVAAADVNGDGKPDLIVANQIDSTVSVLLNTTTPGSSTISFAAQPTFATGHYPNCVTVADVNGDGKPDLVVANYNDGTVSVLLNTTAPGAVTSSFSAQQIFATGNGPPSVAVADVNGDGKPDLIVANAGGHTVSVLLNTTTPGSSTLSFAAQRAFAIGNNPSSVTTADVNGDGKPDLIVANYGGYTVSVLLNTTVPGAGAPSFAAPQTFATSSYSFSVTAADINGDGKPDLIVGNTNSNNVSVLLNTQLQAAVSSTPATGTIVHDYIFADGFGP